jgi:hypothetical protein
MDTNHHAPEDDLNRLERRLADWRPSDAALDADGMLFAAGRASALTSPVRFVWPALTSLAALLAIALGLWATTERAERIRLTQQIRDLSAPVAPPAPISPSTDDGSPAGGYLATRQLVLDRGVDAWTDSGPPAIGPAVPVPEPGTILQVWRRDRLLDP